MNKLYPEIEPESAYRLAVEHSHELYVEECGAKDGLPVIFLHGGPGAGCKPYHRQFFNPDRYRIVLFDQRGAGRSTPLGELSANNTQALIEDVERIRDRLGIDQWLVFGGSWGAALALLYAEKYPERILGLILRGVFLATQWEIDWFFNGGVNRIFPDHWAEFTQLIPEDERDDMLGAYHRRIGSDDEQTRLAAARAWSTWTDAVVTYTVPSEQESLDNDEGEKILKKVSIECHYAHHRFFLRHNQILNDIDRLPRVPVTIIHGRRDLTCALESSWRLSQAIQYAKLIILPDSGHLANEPAMIDALVGTTDRFGLDLR